MWKNRLFGAHYPLEVSLDDIFFFLQNNPTTVSSEPYFNVIIAFFLRAVEDNELDGMWFVSLTTIFALLHEKL